MTSLHDQAYLYVVGALSAAEAAEFEDHQVECLECREEVAILRELTAELSSTVTIAPPARLRAAILDAVAQTPQPPARTARDANAGGPAPLRSVSTSEPADTRAAASGAASGQGSTTVVPMRRSTGIRLPSLLAAAAVIVALGFGGWLWQDRQAARNEAQQATQQTTQLTELLSSEDVKMVSGRGVASGMSGTVVLSRSQRKAVMVASHLPQLPAGKVYEAWTIRREPVPAGTFTPDQAKTVVALPPRVLRAQSVAVTVEPAGGSAHPTTDAIFTVNIPRSA